MSFPATSQAQNEEKFVLLNDLPDPDQYIEAGVPDLPPALSGESGGWKGAAIRLFKGIPRYVWVKNQHSEMISVTVSQYKPRRLLTGGGLEGGADSLGFDLNAETYKEPPTTKCIQPKGNAVFPLWSRKHGCGCITISLAGVVEIENDEIPAGATGFYRGYGRLILRGWDGKPIVAAPAIEDPPLDEY